MASKTIEVVVWVMVDEDGDAVATVGERDSSENLSDLFDENIGGASDIARRVIKVVLNVPLPAPVTLKADVPAEGEAVLSVS